VCANAFWKPIEQPNRSLDTIYDKALQREDFFFSIFISVISTVFFVNTGFSLSLSFAPCQNAPGCLLSKQSPATVQRGHPVTFRPVPFGPVG
jgi:hypothetical protein